VNFDKYSNSLTFNGLPLSECGEQTITPAFIKEQITKRHLAKEKILKDLAAGKKNPADNTDVG